MDNFNERINLFKHKFINDKNCGFILINLPEDCFYFSGYNSSNAYILISDKKKYYLTDSRYFEEAKKKILHLEVVLIKKGLPQVLKKICGNKIVSIFKNSVSYNLFSVLKDILKIEIINESVKEIIRDKKNTEEINNVRKAVEITESAILKIKGLLKTGVYERDISLELEYTGRKSGADDISFKPIVLFGKNTSYPHGHPGKTKLKNNDMILIDCGFKYNNYCSDVTRMYVMNNKNKEFLKLYSLMLDIQKQAIEECFENKKIADIENNIIFKLKKYGLEKNYLHSTGHGVGLEIHEFPVISKKSDFSLEIGNLFTIEPGIYIADNFGIRIEDMILMKKDGYENLTKNISKELKDIVL